MIPQGNTTLQNDPEDNTYTTNKGTHQPQHVMSMRTGQDAQAQENQQVDSS